MKILRIKKPENENENHQLKDLEDGDSIRQDFEITLEDNPDQKYLGKIIIEKLSDEEPRKSKRKFAIKKIKCLKTK